MGWKNLKEHYQIGHIVQVTDVGICIGSGYVHNIIVIGFDGAIIKRYDDHANDDLMRYQKAFDADPGLVRRLVEAPDVFSDSLTVYTYVGGEIIEKQCEAVGWPNVTHDGQIMHDNTFSVDKATVVAWAKSEAGHTLKYVEQAETEAEKRLAEWQDRRRRVLADMAKLETDYPQ